MKYVFTQVLCDDELRRHLANGDSLVFKGLAQEWQQIELQVERLGFGNEYIVSRTHRAGATGEEDLARVNPVRPRRES